jgi:predicted dehydrogenase
MSSPKVRIGFIGAGAISKARHLPGLKKIDGVELVAVSNRSKESAQAIADEWGFDDVVDDWRGLLTRDDIDAIFIGTWPYMHKEMSIAVLEAGKHCFTQARMAMNLDESKAMLAAAQARSDLVSMICPAPSELRPFVKHVVQSGQLGEITSFELNVVSGDNLDKNSIHWREKIEFSGRQAMWLGVFTETLHQVFGNYESLSAQKITPIPDKTDESGKDVKIGIPQVITVSGKLESGGLGVEHHSAVAVDQSSCFDRLWIRGLNGTLKYEFGDSVEMAGPGESLKPVTDVPEDLRFTWKVEQEFVDAVRKAMEGAGPEERPVSPDFVEGIAYMRKIEAVHLSSDQAKVIRPADL